VGAADVGLARALIEMPIQVPRPLHRDLLAMPIPIDRVAADDHQGAEGH
jgi:hypothetical protein